MAARGALVYPIIHAIRALISLSDTTYHNPRRRIPELTLWLIVG